MFRRDPSKGSSKWLHKVKQPRKPIQSDAMRIFFKSEIIVWLSTGIWDGGMRGNYKPPALPQSRKSSATLHTLGDTPAGDIIVWLSTGIRDRCKLNHDDATPNCSTT
ncbi:unnamed protein product [Polarella glacialis]|uniref:Uncharacterized protein n=1 Tax=Polarella glacialis TaxID=89957 RepID=A0A813HR54_POLGL|nr:unnamed protein product [Polarella glacialis]